MILPKSLYYFYDNKWFDSKWQVIDYAHTHGHYSFNINQVRCVLNKDFSFDKYDWKVEPSKSWEELTLDRMLKIRDTFSKICLLYSAGSDSHYILTLCLKYNIKIDEICTIYSGLKSFPNDWLNWDMDNVGIPFVKNHASHIPYNIHIIDDWNKYTDTNVFSFEGLFKDVGVICTAVSTAYPVVVEEYRKKGFICIHGSTEPNIYYDKDNDKYFAEMYDTDNFLDRNTLPNTVAFFSDPSYPEIHIKQCHLVKNYLRSHNIKNCDGITNYDLFKQIYCALTRDGYRIDKKSPQYVKTVKHHIFNTKKQEMFFKALYKGNKRSGEQYHYFLGNSINGKPLYRHPKGVRLGKWYLE